MEKLANVTKVVIIEKRAALDGGSDKKEEEEGGDKKPDPHKPTTEYSIILEDSNGHKEKLDPYFGDPNTLLCALEKIQAQKTQTSRAEVFYET